MASVDHRNDGVESSGEPEVVELLPGIGVCRHDLVVGVRLDLRLSLLTLIPGRLFFGRSCLWLLVLVAIVPLFLGVVPVGFLIDGVVVVCSSW